MIHNVETRLNLRNFISRRKWFNGSNCRWEWKSSFFNNWDFEKEFRDRSKSTNGRYVLKDVIYRNIEIYSNDLLSYKNLPYILGIKNAGNTAIQVLFVLLGISSLICFFHSPRQVFIKCIFVRNLKGKIWYHHVPLIFL